MQAKEALELNELWDLRSGAEICAAGSASCSEAGDAERIAPEGLSSRTLLPASRACANIGYADWVALIEPLIVFDPAFASDPAAAYATYGLREPRAYRKRMAEVARYSDCTEMEVATHALSSPRKPRSLHRRRSAVASRGARTSATTLSTRAFPALRSAHWISPAVC